MAQILIIDDDPAVRDYYKDLLSAEGHSLELAPNGHQGLALMEKRRYDLVIVDRNMPGMSGIQMLQKARQNPSLKSVKVMMCTSAATVAEIGEAFEAGANDYIVKPVDARKLLEKVARHLGPASASR